MARLIALALIAAMGCRLLFGRWPWQLLALPPAAPGTAQARSLLGVPTGATRAQIVEAHKRLLVQVHPDRGGSAALVHEANAARDLLLARLPPG